MKASSYLRNLRKQVKDRSPDGQDFYEDHAKRYAQLARSIARQLLQGEQPEELSRDQWNDHIDSFLNLISPERLTKPSGIRIGQDGKIAALKRNLGKKSDDPNVSIITDADIFEWVTTEKNLTAEDQKLSAKREGQDATTVTAIIGHVLEQHFFGFADRDYSSLQKRLEDFVEKKGTPTGFQKIIPAILAAWMNIFSVRFPEDLKQHKVREFEKIVSQR
jgi:hypothetical protein